MSLNEYFGEESVEVTVNYQLCSGMQSSISSAVIFCCLAIYVVAETRSLWFTQKMSWFCLEFMISGFLID